MSRAALLARPVLPLLCAALLTACGDDSTGPNRLTPEDVSGSYAVCSLSFDPAGSLAPVDVRAQVIETGSGSLILTNQSSTQLTYRAKGDLLVRFLDGSFSLGRGDVTLTFSGQADRKAALLLPADGVLTLDFDALSRTLSTSSLTYSVARADYERVSGTSEPNLAANITGTLTASFTAGGCP
ncbi:hypothetical protein BH23GEM4_BH23GEM4_06980 [soil metagenome]|jgi:hypothetical protein